MSGKIRAFELQSKNKTDLLKQLHELKTELASLRVQKIAGGSAAKLTKMRWLGFVLVRDGIKDEDRLTWEAWCARGAHDMEEHGVDEAENGQLDKMSRTRTMQQPKPNLAFHVSSVSFELSLTSPHFFSNTTRKSVARVLTVINQKQRQNVREMYKQKNSKYLPLDLRYKKTRAIRRALTKNERSLITEKQHKKDIHFPIRKFALKA
ncbi:hypothetical protein QFC22_000688 [Naganishia vaughanmartiniae]|uniref:Uncharacterized protein n=1 Tax=Naganishia vaughanmartiniae TaxID=1424756 RepID=A0ACC2XKK6_9TREE|nr:hypothetical protein QFC22_000688 [Naganishia vaughanmartiniae]